MKMNDITFENFMLTFHGLLTDMFDDDSDERISKMVDFHKKYPAYTARLRGNEGWVTLCKSLAGKIKK